MAETDQDAAAARRLFVLVLRCQAGDEGAFTELHRQFSGRTLRYLKGLVGDPMADDAQQEVWLTVYRRIAEVANPAGFRTWLYRVTRHRAIDLLRRERHRTDLVNVEAADLDAVPDPRPSDGGFGTTDLEPILARLSAPHREVLLLRFWEEMSYADVALVVGCSIGTVRSRLHHAKEHVRGLLGAEGETS